MIAQRPENSTKRECTVKRKPAKQTRMKSSQPRAFDDRLVGVFSFDNAIPVINEYLASNDDHPGFLFNWNVDNRKAFVATANDQLPANAPAWMQTPPPHMTANTLVDDIVRVLREDAGGSCGRVLLAPNNTAQFGRITAKLFQINNDGFMQQVAQGAFGNVEAPLEQLLALTYSLTEARAQQSVLIGFGMPLGGGLRLFH